MSNFKATLWPLIKDEKEGADLLSTGRSTINNHNSPRLRSELRRSVEFQLTSICEDTNSLKTDRAGFNLKGQEIPMSIISTEQSEQKTQKRVIYKNVNYEVLNLTWTLYNINPPKKWFGILFGTSVLIRLYIFVYLLVVLYFTIEWSIPTKWMWTIVICATRVIYAVLVLRVSLSVSDGPLETTLKNCWNRQEIMVNEVFEVLTWKVIRTVLVKAIIPPQLSFLYISQSDVKRKFLMYSVINYIFLGIEFVIFYPFLIAYCLLSIYKSHLSLVDIDLFTNLTLVCGLGWMCLFLIYSIYLLISGVRIKYEKMTF